MKTTILSATAFLLLSTGLTLADMSGRTDDGRAVILYDNGTWAFVTTGAGTGPTTTPPTNATTTFTTGPGWKVVPLDQAALGWQRPGFDDSTWQPVASQWANAPVPPQAIVGMQDTRAEWVWQRDDVDEAAFRFTFDLSAQPSEALIRITADNAYSLYVNDTLIGADTANEVSVWQGAETYMAAAYLVAGRNVIAVVAKDYGARSGLLADVTLKGAVANVAAGVAGTTGTTATGTTGTPTVGTAGSFGSNTGKGGPAPGATRPTGGAIALGPVNVGLQDVDVYQYSYRNWDDANWAHWSSLALSSNVTGIPDTDRRIYFRFDPQPLAPAINAGLRVKLQLSAANTSTGTQEVELFRVVTPWQPGSGTYHSGQDEPNAAPGEITWNNQPVIDFSRPFASTVMGPGAQSYTFDITELVAGWLSGQFANFGLVLVGKDEGSSSYHFIFDATESSHIAQRPQIIVTPASGQTGGQTGIQTGAQTSAQTGQIGPNLIRNGSFESATYANGESIGIAPWEVVGDNVDVVGSYWQQVDGAYSIDLSATPSSGGIAQDVATIPGATYEVSFMMAGNPACEDPRKQMRVSAAGQSRDYTFDTTGHSLTDLGWSRQSWQFVANAPTTRLVFKSLGPNIWCGMALDAVEMHKL